LLNRITFGEPSCLACLICTFQTFLIFAKDVKSLVEGYGIIDENGHRKHFNRDTGTPMLIRFKNCKDISILDVNIINPAAWISAWFRYDEIVVDAIQIHNRVNGNDDGLILMAAQMSGYQIARLTPAMNPFVCKHLYLKGHLKM